MKSSCSTFVPQERILPAPESLSNIIHPLARDSSVSPLASGASSIPMVWYSNSHDPHTGMDVGDALPWVGRVPERDATIESQRSTRHWSPRSGCISRAALPVRYLPRYAVVERSFSLTKQPRTTPARQGGQDTAPTSQRSALVARPDTDQETYTSAFGKSRENGNRIMNAPTAGGEEAREGQSLDGQVG